MVFEVQLETFIAAAKSYGFVRLKNKTLGRYELMQYVHPFSLVGRKYPRVHFLIRVKRNGIAKVFMHIDWMRHKHAANGGDSILNTMAARIRGFKE